MSRKPVTNAPEFVRSIAPGVAEKFHAMRQELYNTGPLDVQTRELIMAGAFATAGYEMPFKNHARRLVDMGVPIEATRQAVLVTLASTCTLKQVADALNWVEEVYDRGGEGKTG